MRKPDGVLQSSLGNRRLVDWTENAAEFGLRSAGSYRQNGLDRVLEDCFCVRARRAIESRRLAGANEHKVRIDLLGFSHNCVRWRTHGKGGFVDHDFIERQ